MEELSIEEKAKAYDEALSVAQETYTTQPMYRDWLAKMFPELVESENERIRQGLINGFNECLKDCPYPQNAVKYWHGIDINQILTWLEKQGEQINLPQFTFDDVLALQCVMETVKKVQEDKELYEQLQSLHNRLYDAYWLEKQGEQPTDKIEPKFKVGDWIVDDETPNDVFCVIEVLEEINKVIDIDGDDYHIPHCKVDKQFHRWTIQDAKDGDVLVSGDVIFIFNNIHGVWVRCYCSLCKDCSFKDRNYDLMYTKDSKEVYPATKEQRDLLFQKMKNEGYEWDDEKKELKKIEDKMLDADKVIEWLKPYGCVVDNIVEQFKKDFGL